MVTGSEGNKKSRKTIRFARGGRHNFCLDLPPVYVKFVHAVRRKPRRRNVRKRQQKHMGKLQNPAFAVPVLVAYRADERIAAYAPLHLVQDNLSVLSGIVLHRTEPDFRRGKSEHFYRRVMHGACICTLFCSLPLKI